MARKRLISPEFFTHADLYDAEAAVGLPLRLAFAGLWTASDKRGLFRWKPRELKLAILPYDDVDFGAVLDALESAGFVVRYLVDGKEYGRIPSFAEWQTFHPHEKPAKDIPEPPDDGGKPTNGRPRPTNGGPVPDNVRTDPSVTVTGTGTVTDIGSTATTSPPKAAARTKAVAKHPPTWLTPYIAAWAARFESADMPIDPSVGPLRKLEKLHGAPEVLRRWTIYLAQTSGSYANAPRFAATWGEWSGEGPKKGADPLVAEATMLWDRYKAAGLLTRWQRSEYERIGAEQVQAGHYPSVQAFLDELRVTQPWSLGDARTDGYAISTLAQRLAAPRKVVA